MDPGLDFIKTELEIARTMLAMADTEAALPDPEGARSAINNASTALETARKFLPKVDLTDAERLPFEQSLEELEAELQARLA